jgi:hypothetical protein
MRKIIFILLALSILACNKDDDNKPTISETKLGLITGINLLPESGPSPIRLGNPNIFIDKNIVSVYPNPVINVLTINSYYEITDVWIIPASPEKIHQETNFEMILNSNTYSEIELTEKASFEINNNNSTTAPINFENLDPGYYRVFIKTNNTIMWDNILFIDDGELQDVFNYWD